MKYVQTFESFLNEKKSYLGPFKEGGNLWFWKEIRATGFEKGNTEVSAYSDAGDAGTALVDYLADKKPFKSSGFTIAPDELKKIENMDKVTPWEDKVFVTIVDSKTDEKYNITLTLRDSEWGVSAPKSLLAEVQKHGGLGGDWVEQANAQKKLYAWQKANVKRRM